MMDNANVDKDSEEELVINARLTFGEIPILNAKVLFFLFKKECA